MRNSDRVGTRAIAARMTKISNMSRKRFIITFLCLRDQWLGLTTEHTLGSLTIMIGARGDLFPENSSKIMVANT